MTDEAKTDETPWVTFTQDMNDAIRKGRANGLTVGNAAMLFCDMVANLINCGPEEIHADLFAQAISRIGDGIGIKAICTEGSTGETVQ